MLSTDYLIVGSGALGLAFADQLLTETDAHMVIVDRHHMPGGHWNDAYPFVRLHQPSAYYGVGSRMLGSDRIDESGFNKGYYELAAGVEISSYYDRLMQERFLPSGRVQYFPMCDYVGESRFVSSISGAVHEVAFRKLVDATFFKMQVPSTHTPSFEMAEGVNLVTPNTLPKRASGHKTYAILGGGKTAMDVGIWLLQMGASPENIRWIVPRDSWLMNRDTTQPGDAFFGRVAGGQADQFEAAAEATSIEDLFTRLERTGQLLRIDQSVWPTMFRGATISRREVDVLRTIKDVVRLGHVRRIERNAIVLEHGTVEAAPTDIYVDCTAKAFGGGPNVTIFGGDRITLQMTRAGFMCFSAAFIAHVEAAYDNEAEKNELCVPIAPWNENLDWVHRKLQDIKSGRRWAADKDLRHWMSEHRLSSSGVSAAVAQSAEAACVRERLRTVRVKAEANLERLASETG